ncbi:unnamed protein product [Effrenium voratum]|nr:unnamed protein product [Effrenium voratum]
MVINVTFKISGTGGGSFALDLEPSMTMLDVKNKAKDEAKMEPEHMKIIFKGRILKDTDTVESLKIESGQAMHLVRSAPSGTTPAATPAAAPAATPAAAPTPGLAPAAPAPGAAPTGPGYGGAAANPLAAMMQDPAMMQAMMGGMGGMGGGMGGMGGMPGAGAGAGAPGANPMGGMMGDPAMMAQLFQNPMVQQMIQNITQNPALMQQMIQSNPMLQQMAQNNPMMQQMLTNPQLLQAVLNPQMLQAMGAGGGMGGMGGMPALGGFGAPGATPGAGAPGAAPTAPGAAPTAPARRAGRPRRRAHGARYSAGPGTREVAMMQNPEAMQAMMNMMGGMGGAGGMGALGGMGGMGGAGAPPGGENFVPTAGRCACGNFESGRGDGLCNACRRQQGAGFRFYPSQTRLSWCTGVEKSRAQSKCLGAARLKSLNTRYGTQLLVSSETLQSSVGELFVARTVGRLILKGRTSPTHTLEVIGRKGQVPQDLEQAAEFHEEAAGLFAQGRFEEAKVLFEQASQVFVQYDEGSCPQDKPSAHMLDLCNMYHKNPPDLEKWDGSEHLNKKAWS